MTRNDSLISDKGEKMRDNWLDVTEDGHPSIEWERAADNAIAFDGGARDYDACLGKLITAVQREAFDAGYRKGLEADKKIGNAMLSPAGHA